MSPLVLSLRDLSTSTTERHCYVQLCSKEYEDLSVKAKSKFSISLRGLSQPMSLGAIARTWDVCARAVVSEHAQQSGSGSFSSKYGTWENCLSAS